MGTIRIRTGIASALAVVLLVACSGPATERSALRSPESDSPTAAPGSTPTPTPSAATDSTPRVARARTARQVVRQILTAEAAIADPATTTAELRLAARVQQLAYRVLGTRPGWDKAVYAALPPRLHSVVRDNVAARREFRSMHTTLSRTLPAWRIVEPEPAEELMRFYGDAEAAYGVGWEYLAAINLVETAMGRIRGTSVAGAQGPMQFIPTTWARWGRGDVNDPADAIMAAARYLASNGFARGPRGVANALYEYNNHPAYVRGVTAYAKVMERRPRAFLAYHQWDVYYLTTEGDVLLPVGYERTKPVPVRRYLATHPQG
ncbi:lytic transglycosylase domain-containing protein [Nocardioides dilutus]